MKQFIFTLLMIYIFIAIKPVNAQNEEAIPYKLLYSHPVFNSLSINFAPLIVNAGSAFNGSFGVGTGAFLTHENFIYSLDYKLYYVYDIDKDIGLATSLNRRPKFTDNLNLMVGIPFYQRIKKEKIHIRLFTERLTSTWERDHYLEVDSKTSTSINFDVSFDYGKSIYDFRGYPLKTRLIDKDVVADEVITFQLIDGPTTFYDYRTINFGLSSLFSSNTKIDVEGYGIRRDRSLYKFYVHASYLVKTNIDDIKIPIYEQGNNASEYPIGYDLYQLEDAVDMQNWGIKIGAEMLPSDRADINFYFEGGIKPGPRDEEHTLLSNSYLHLGMNISLDILNLMDKESYYSNK